MIAVCCEVDCRLTSKKSKSEFLYSLKMKNIGIAATGIPGNKDKSNPNVPADLLRLYSSFSMIVKNLVVIISFSIAVQVN